MKKKYMKPEIEVIELKTSGMLATSVVLPDSEINDIIIGARPMEISPEDLLGDPNLQLPPLE